jgi:hypothetical protein
MDSPKGDGKSKTRSSIPEKTIKRGEQSVESSVLSTVPISRTDDINTTILDHEDDSDSKVISWSDISENVGFLEKFGKDSSTSSTSSEDTVEQQPKPKAEPSMIRRKIRSANRDDSDSEDENGAPIVKLPRSGSEDDVIDLNHNPFTDEVSKRNGFKVGFSEDRNKKYRRSMEVLCFLITGFAFNCL